MAAMLRARQLSSLNPAEREVASCPLPVPTPAGLPVAPLCLRWALHLAQVSAP